MRVQILSPHPGYVGRAIVMNGGEVVNENPDWIVSFGHREIIRDERLRTHADRMVNLHISLLPWNRGADPNFWSWFNDTPKGVTLHFIDGGIDTGPIIAQQELDLDPAGTLRTTYGQLQFAAIGLFTRVWPEVIAGKIQPVAQDRAAGSYHNCADKTTHFERYGFTLDTVCSEIVSAGEAEGEAQMGAIAADKIAKSA